MARFETMPAVAWLGVDQRYPWRLQEDLVYHSDILGTVVVPAGYCTDFASVPRLPIVYWWTGGRAVLPSIVHDYLFDCWTDRITRRQADAVFWEAMKVRRDPRWGITRFAMWAGVRIGGGRAWRRDSSDKCVG